MPSTYGEFLFSRKYDTHPYEISIKRPKTHAVYTRRCN